MLISRPTIGRAVDTELALLQYLVHLAADYRQRIDLTLAAFFRQDRTAILCVVAQ